ncbi:hypothetical protein [Streptomyces yaizuensis]|uniref:XRE family transcriptional regulator n=1 Tax=Streptomyces yaizuensis TaxID=2989713 RepID=A0ABQ5PBM9_9ACTN|nr:hypothetical protein [Streptomyces sp. YSPA8]GLF99935.1 hypothetical protein SYYSPA8_36580 [Streptomyces sp. YSPA8]
MATDFRQLQRLARALGLTYQQLLARYRAAHGRGAPRAGALTWARLRALDDSLAGSLAHAPTWALLSLRLDPEVLARLVARADADRAERDRIAPGHYIDAALRTGPRRPTEQRACTRNFLQARGNSLPRTGLITVRLSPDAHTALRVLRSAHADGGRSFVHAAASALTDHFLTRLPPQPAAAAGHTGRP